MRYICSLLLLLLSFLTNAQDIPIVSRVIKVDFGPKIGVNLSKLNGESWDGGYKTNLLGGLFLNVHNNRFGGQIEGLFTQTTYVTGKDFHNIYRSYLNSGVDSLEEGRFRISYFNIPVMAQVRILGKAWLQVGAQYSGVVSVKDKDKFLKDAEGLFKNGSVSAVGGLWIDVTRRINAGARYVIGLSNLNEDNVTENWKQRDVQLHIGLTF